MTPGASSDLLLKDPEGLFVDPFSGTDGNKFYPPGVLNSIDDSKRTDSSWLASSPFALLIQWALGSPVSRGATDELTKVAFLSCTSTPPRRVHLTRAADLLTSYVDRKPRSTGTSRKLLGPTAFPEIAALFCADPFEPASRKLCPALGKSRLKGLATRLTCLSASTSLEISFNLQRSWASPFRAFSPPG